MIYTISEIANMAIMPREPMMDTVVLPVDTVNALIADWRGMHDYLRWHTSEGNGQLHPLASGILANLKVKP